MRCQDARPLLSGYLDQELTIDEMRRTAAHLQSCRPCESELNELEKTQALLNGLQPASPRRDFWMDAYAGLASERPRPSPWWQRLTHGQRSVVFLTPAVMAAAMTILLQLQPAPRPQAAPDPVDRMDDLVQAHLEARTSQPLADQGVVRMLLVNAQSQGDPLGK